MAAAKAEFLEKGFSGASLRKIVKTAGVTTGAFYGYCSNKDALFSALTDRMLRQLSGNLYVCRKPLPSCQMRFSRPIWA